MNTTVNHIPKRWNPGNKKALQRWFNKLPTPPQSDTPFLICERYQTIVNQ